MLGPEAWPQKGQGEKAKAGFTPRNTLVQASYLSTSVGTALLRSHCEAVKVCGSCVLDELSVWAVDPSVSATAAVPGLES